MSLARLRVARAGPHVTVQDAGRPGFLRFGVPWSGPMDRAAHAAALAALGADPQAPALEVSLGGLTLDCLEGALTVALTGGAFRLLIDGVPRGAWTVASLRAGQRLEVRPGPSGAWATLAFAGRLRARRWLGAAATHGPSGFGGGAVAEGAELIVEDAALREDREGPVAEPPWAAAPLATARVTLGPQDRHFAADTLAAFLSEPFAITESRDRMGARLAGPSLTPSARLDIPSEAIARGSVQVSGDGAATVLLADHQTTGGYPKIATVISADLDGLAQLRPGERLRFAAVTPEEAVAAARARATEAAAHLAAAAARPGGLAARLLSANLIGGVMNAAEDPAP